MLVYKLIGVSMPYFKIGIYILHSIKANAGIGGLHLCVYVLCVSCNVEVSYWSFVRGL